MRKRYLWAVLSLAGCASAPSESLAIDQPAGACDARALTSLIGQQATREISLKLMELSRARTLRWVPHDGMVTMDYSPQRLTVRLDAQNRILAAKCG